MSEKEFLAKIDADKKAKWLYDVNMAIMVKAGKASYDTGTAEEQLAKAEAVILAAKKLIAAEVEAAPELHFAVRDLKEGLRFVNGQTRDEFCAEYIDLIKAEFQAEDNYRQLSGAAMARAAKVQELTAELSVATTAKNAADAAASSSESKLTAARTARAAKRAEWFEENGGAGDGEG